MSPPNVEVVANDVGHLTDRVEKLEAKVEAVMLTQRWQMGAAVGFGVVMTILLPRVASVLGLS
jgi:tetrahydromethanopterin S-methyltransferase subunit G